jgi:hypothetical protein
MRLWAACMALDYAAVGAVFVNKAPAASGGGDGGKAQPAAGGKVRRSLLR